MTDPIEKLAEALETFDRRLSNIDQRFVKVEHYLAEDAAASEEGARQAQKLAELYVSIDQRLEQLTAMMSNYVDATGRLRRETALLHSEVREKLKVAGG